MNAPSTSREHLPTTQVSANQEATNVLEGKGYEEKTPDLIALFNAHAEGNIPAVAVVSRPLTFAATRTSSVNAVDRKRKRA